MPMLNLKLQLSYEKILYYFVDKPDNFLHWNG